MYNFLVSTHSILRWILAILLILTILYAAVGRVQKKPFKQTRIFSLVSLIVLHLQFILGLILYFVSPKVIFSSSSMKAPLTRFFMVEHLIAMLIAIVLITIGFSSAKRILDETKKYNRILVYYIIGFLIILAAIPWPFYNLGTDWL